LSLIILLLTTSLFWSCQDKGYYFEPTAQQAEASADNAKAKTESIRANSGQAKEIVKDAIAKKDLTELPKVPPLMDQNVSDSIIVDSAVFDLVSMLKQAETQIHTLKEENKKLVQENKELKERGSFRTLLPWFIVLGGVACAVMGRFMFNSISATISGVGIAISSIVVNAQYNNIEKYGSWIFWGIVAYIVFSLIIKHEFKSKLAKDEKELNI